LNTEKYLVIFGFSFPFLLYSFQKYKQRIRILLSPFNLEDAIFISIGILCMDGSSVFSLIFFGV
jgi:hypothetical protein